MKQKRMEMIAILFLVHTFNHVPNHVLYSTQTMKAIAS
jgi:hypothetical protein